MAYIGTTVKIPLGHTGLLTDLPSGDIPPGALIKADNVSFERGFLEKARGAIRYNTTALSAGVVALIDWWPDSVRQRIIAATADGKIFRDIGDRTFTGQVAIKSGLGVLTPRAMFVAGGNEVTANPRKLFFFSRNNQLQVLSGDGVSFIAVSGPAADWVTPKYPVAGLIHRNRLWAFMGQYAYASSTSNHENFSSSSLANPVFPGEGGEIIGGFIYKGRMFVFKEQGFVYYLDDSDPDEDNWFFAKIASNFGLSSPHGIIEADDDMVAVNAAGAPTSYAATQKLGSVESGDLMRLFGMKNYFRDHYSISGNGVTHALYYEHKKMAFVTYRSKYQTTNDVLFVVDYNGQQPRPSFWTKDNADCLALRSDVNSVNHPMYGSSDGRVYLMDFTQRLTGLSTAYEGGFKTGHLDFGKPDTNKVFDWLAIEFYPEGTWNLTCDVYIDGKFIESIRYAMDLRTSGSATNIQTVQTWGQEGSQTTIMPLHGAGRRISFHVRNSGSNETFSIPSITIGFRASGQQSTTNVGAGT